MMMNRSRFLPLMVVVLAGLVAVGIYALRDTSAQDIDTSTGPAIDGRIVYRIEGDQGEIHCQFDAEVVSDGGRIVEILRAGSGSDIANGEMIQEDMPVDEPRQGVEDPVPNGDFEGWVYRERTGRFIKAARRNRRGGTPLASA